MVANCRRKLADASATDAAGRVSAGAAAAGAYLPLAVMGAESRGLDLRPVRQGVGSQLRCPPAALAFNRPCALFAARLLQARRRVRRALQPTAGRLLLLLLPRPARQPGRALPASC